ncbi:MAG: glycosyltransferase family 2 protein [SAR202 cluster bacterium]|nr:glycosyltransferase family 2 protein [SAR202 cluster bacterium]
MQSNGPKVRVIIPTHNRAHLVSRSIDSVLAQTFADFELLVVDDASSDGTEGVVKAIADPRVRYLRHEQNRGASGARNTGLANMRGTYVAFLDDDDEWLPTKLEEQVSQLDSEPADVGMVYCWMDYFDEDGKLVGETHPTLKGYVFDQLLDRQRLAGCPTLLVRAEVAREMGGFDERLVRGNDGDFIRRVCLRYKVDVLPKVLVKVHVGHGPRLTSSTARGIAADARGVEIRLEKFKAQYARRPRERGATLRHLAVLEARLGRRRSAWRNFMRGATLSPEPGRLFFDLARFVKANVGR